VSVPGPVRWNGYLQREGRLRVSAAGVIVDCDEAAANALRARPAELRGMPAARAFAALGRRGVAWWNTVSADRWPTAGLSELPGMLEITETGLDGAFRSTVFTVIAGRPGRRESLSIGVRATGLDPADEVDLLRAELRSLRGLDLPAGQVTLVVDGDPVVSRVLAPTHKSAGWEPWRLVGLPVLAAVHPDDRPSALKSLVECLAAPGAPAWSRETAARLAELVEPDRIARLGGGRFVIVGPYGGPPRRLKALARSMLRATALPVAYLTHQIPVVVGTATGGADGLAGHSTPS
jgi:hypothetical protein